MSDTPIKDFLKQYDEACIFIVSIIVSIIIAISFQIAIFRFTDYTTTNAMERNCSFIRETVASDVRFMNGLCISKKDDKVYIYSKYGTEIKRKELIVE